LFQRDPDSEEQAVAAEFFAKHRALSSPTGPETSEEAWTAFTRSLLSSNEFLFLD
jgi:hypothetical protein